MMGTAGLIGGGLTNSGSMPVSAAGGMAGPSTATSNTRNGFSVGALNMGSGSNKTLLIVSVLAIAALFIVVKK